MIDREQLIKKAAEAMVEYDNPGAYERGDVIANWDDYVGAARAAFAVFEEAQKPVLPPIKEFVLIEDGKEADWVDPVIEFDEQPDGYRIWNGYSNYWFAKTPDTTYVIRAKEQRNGS